MKKIVMLLLAIVPCGCEQLLSDQNNNIRNLEVKDIEWVQHQYTIVIPGTAFNNAMPEGLKHWNGYYTSFIETWPESFKGKKEPSCVCSHRRWYPGDYGYMFWDDFGKDTVRPEGSWYEYGKDSHPFTKEVLSSGKTQVTFDMYGRTWTGILEDNPILLSSDHDDFTMEFHKLLETPYDGSLDELLQEIIDGDN